MWPFNRKPEDDKPEINYCPCESGKAFTDCCGVEGRIAASAPIQTYITAEGVTDKDNQTPEILSAIESISTNPDLFPARFNFMANKGWMVKMSPRWYQESVFLDASRMKGTYVLEVDLPWLNNKCQSIDWRPTSVIFHTAFCGSTLMSQALDAMYNCLSLKEPDTLNNLLFFLRGNGDPEKKEIWFNNILYLLSRSYHQEQSVVVKANDYANPLISKVLEWENRIPVLFMYTPLGEFLVGCLKADNRKEWIRGRYQSILPTAADLINMDEAPEVNDDDFDKMAAMYWSYNIALYNRAYEVGSEKLRSLDFNDMLTAPLASVEACSQFFGLNPLAGVSKSDELDKLMGVYSKNSQFTYSPQQRQNDMDRLLAKFSQELEVATETARKLLGDDYPDNGLKGGLVDRE